MATIEIQNVNAHQEVDIDLGSLKVKIATRFGLFLLLLAAMLFATAGTLRYWEAWGYLAVIVLSTFSIITYFYRRDPKLLERRMRMKEKEQRQQLFMKISVPIFLIAYIIPGFDRRYGWSDVPFGVVVISDVVILAAYYLFALVLQENRYASRVIEVADEQRVVTTGPYAIVRHPMYVAAILINLFSPLALGSYVALAVAALLPLFLVMRIRNEEEVLKRELQGYTDYTQKVRYRLLPGIW